MRWSAEEIDIVKTYYGKLEYTVLLDMLPNRGKHNVRKMAEKLGLTERRQKYTYNHGYFSVLTNESCYWAGFIAADGYVYNRYGTQPGLRITLQRKDKTHLEQFVKCVEYTKPVEDKMSNGYPQSTINVYGCDQWLKDLELYFNIIQAKSLILQPPNLIKRDHIISYLAGYIDGDGSIGYNTYKYKGSIRRSTFTIRWLGTKDLLEWSKTQLDGILGESNATVNKHKGIYVYGINGARAEQFKLTVLSMGLPVLKRKWYKEWEMPEERKVA